MKIIPIISILCVIFMSQANAKNNFYIGTDLLLNNAKHRFINKANAASSNDNTKIDSDAVGFGVNIGYKYDLGTVFIAPEVFYDYIDNSSKDFLHFDAPNYRQDSMEINARYGLKINFGYKLSKKFDIFTTIGAANVYYHNRWASSGLTAGKTELTALYGLGLSYNINNNWSIRTSYDRQQIDTTFVLEGWRDRVTLSTARIGTVYNF